MLRPFDLIFTAPEGFDIISSPIVAVTGGGPSHVRTYMKGLYKDYDFFEATFPRCRFGYMYEINRYNTKVRIGRHSLLYYPLPNYPLPEEISDKGLNTMRRLEGTWYDIEELLITQFLAIIGLEKIDRSDPSRFVCSSAAEWIMVAMGFPYCPGDLIVSPIDLVKSNFIEWVEE